MEENDTVYYDYVQLEVVLYDEDGDKWYSVPEIIQLDNTVTDVYVTDREPKHSDVVVCKNDENKDIRFTVENSKLHETFDTIHKSLKKIAGERWYDNNENHID